LLDLLWLHQKRTQISVLLYSFCPQLCKTHSTEVSKRSSKSGSTINSPLLTYTSYDANTSSFNVMKLFSSPRCEFATRKEAVSSGRCRRTADRGVPRSCCCCCYSRPISYRCYTGGQCTGVALIRWEWVYCQREHSDHTLQTTNKPTTQRVIRYVKFKYRPISGDLAPRPLWKLWKIIRWKIKGNSYSKFASRGQAWANYKLRHLNFKGIDGWVGAFLGFKYATEFNVCENSSVLYTDLPATLQREALYNASQVCTVLWLIYTDCIRRHFKTCSILMPYYYNAPRKKATFGYLRGQDRLSRLIKFTTVSFKPRWPDRNGCDGFEMNLLWTLSGCMMKLNYDEDHLLCMTKVAIAYHVGVSVTICGVGVRWFN